MTNKVKGFFYVTMYPENDNSSTTDQYTVYAYKTSADPDTIYLHQVMKQNDCSLFRTAMQKEIDNGKEGKNFTIVH